MEIGRSVHIGTSTNRPNTLLQLLIFLSLRYLPQERFLLSGNLTQDKQYQWWIPLSLTSANATNATTEPTLWMRNTEASIVVGNLPRKGDWILFNVEGTGYFRVNYDEANWAAVTQQLLSDYQAIEVTTRAYILDDALSLARGG